MSWVGTHTGKAFDLLEPKVSQVSIKDIAWSLSGIERYNAHTKCEHYSVSEHSRNTMYILSEYTLNPLAHVYALLHDAHEAYWGDIISPVKHALGPRVNELMEKTQRVIHEHLGLPAETPPEYQRMIEFADLTMLEVERATLMAPCERERGVEHSVLDDLRNLAFPNLEFGRTAYEDACTTLAARLWAARKVSRREEVEAFESTLRVRLRRVRACPGVSGRAPCGPPHPLTW